jgi:4-amino-4-deoxy-L-arabinose transferase-like glycosyltransferase
MRTRLTQLLSTRSAGIAALLLAALVVGVVLGSDFGAGADEALDSTTGERALTAYAGLEGYRDYLSTGPMVAHFGPPYFMVFTQASRVFTSVLTDWLPSDGRHLTNYLTFLVGVICFYALSLRLLPGRIAFMTTAVFATQPVLFGLGFIDHKDTPFMALFLAAVWLAERAERAIGGSQAAGRPGRAQPEAAGSDEDSRAAAGGLGAHSGIRQAFQRDWRSASPAVRWVLVAAGVALALALWEFTGFGVLQALIRPVATWVHQQAPLRSLLSLVAEDIDKTPIEGYLPRLEWLYGAFIRAAFLLASLVACLAAGRHTLPRTSKWLLLSSRAALLAGLTTGAVLGFAIAIRPIGVFAGVLASGLWIHRLKGRSAGLLLVCWLTAGLIAYEVWPHLWETPLRSFWDSLFLLADFNIHDVLYRGVVYRSDALPWHYLPTLLGLQLTEVVVPFLLLGLPSIIRSARREAGQQALLIGAGLWFVIPVAATQLPGAGLYNGFRLLLFALPPLFIGLGFGLQRIFQSVRAPRAQWLLWGLILVPGVWGIASLHPYEYAYFNAYAGGLRGTQAEFDQEYWCTSYREAMGFVNTVAGPRATVFSGRTLYAAVPFARPDLVLTNQPADLERASLLLYCTRFREDRVFVRGQPVLQVGRSGAVFAQVYQLQGGSPEAP